jgi:hypothetical protein
VKANQVAGGFQGSALNSACKQLNGYQSFGGHSPSSV